MDNNRRAAYRVLYTMEKEDAYSNLELNKVIEKHNPDSPGFVRELVYGVTENKIYIDYILNQFITKGVRSTDSKVLTLLRMAVYQIEFMDSVPEYAAINESVNLAKKVARGRDKFVNGVLRNYLRKRESIEFPSKEKNIEEYFHVKYSVDPSIVKLWISQMGPSKTEKMLAWGNTRPSLMIRVNTLKISKESLKKILMEKGFQVFDSELSSRTLIIKGPDVLATEEYREGYFSVQDVTSTVTAELLEPEPGNLVLDMCSAPGGKALCLAEIMENRGRILAFDIYEHKLRLIENNAKRLGIKIISTDMRDSSVPFEEGEEFADRVLCDVPCTGLGMIRQKPEIKFKKIDDGGKEISNLQLKILENGASRLKKGGRLVYSTCTLNYNENHGVVKKFLEKNQDFVLITEKEFSPENQCNGFYAAVFTKKL